MEPKLKKSLLNKIITKQIFVPSTSLLDQIPLSLTKKRKKYFGIWLESRQQKKKKSGRGDWKSFCFAKIHIIALFLILKLKLFDWKFFKVTYKFKNIFLEQSVLNFEEYL